MDIIRTEQLNKSGKPKVVWSYDGIDYPTKKLAQQVKAKYELTITEVEVINERSTNHEPVSTEPVADPSLVLSVGGGGGQCIDGGDYTELERGLLYGAARMDAGLRALAAHTREVIDWLDESQRQIELETQRAELEAQTEFINNGGERAKAILRKQGTLLESLA